MHTYEVFVDICECQSLASSSCRFLEERYQISADSRNQAQYNALNRAEAAHPKATEYDVRVTRMLA